MVGLKYIPMPRRHDSPLITALGGLYSGTVVTNLGLGLMLVGYFASAITIRLLQDTCTGCLLTLGLVASVVAGALQRLAAFASINLRRTRSSVELRSTCRRRDRLPRA